MSTCTDECVNVGINFIRNIILGVLVNVFGPIEGAQRVARINAAITTLQCKLPQNLLDSIENEIVILRNITTTTLEQENLAYILTIFGTIFLLTIFNFISQLIANTTATVIFFILSILVIIVAVAGLYFWLQSIFNNSAIQATASITRTTDILNNTIQAFQEGFCCLGQCAPCSTCILPIT